jgi:histidine triad (HIT) family protein
MPHFVDPSAPGSCVFCRLIRGEIPSSRVHADEHTLAFMDLGQVSPGHVLVAVRRRAATLLGITPEEAAAVMQTARRVALAIKPAFDPPGITLLQASGSDGIALSWPRKDPPREQLEEHAARIRPMLAAAA